MEKYQARQLVDTDRYPIDALASEAGRTLTADCQASLDRDAICVLPDFIRPDALAAMVAEAEQAAPQGHRLDAARVSYGLSEHGVWPPDHPRNHRHDNRYCQVLSHQLNNQSALRKLFLWPVLTEFVRQAMGAPTLYTSACPHLSLSLHIAGEGDCNGWHYDPNDGVVTLMLQAPDAGGAFEYAPYIRSQTDQNYDGVSDLFENPDGIARRPQIAPGSFVLFNGSLSLHHVTPVGPTTRPRIIAIFSYDEQPNQVFNQEYIDWVHTFPQGLNTA